MAVVMFKCFECDFASNTMDDVKIHIHLEHEREEDHSENKDSPQLIEIDGKELNQLLQKPATIVNSSSSLKWSHGMVLHYLECVKKHLDKFNSAGYTSKRVWDEVSEEFSERYYGVTGYNCYEKWRNLKRTYRNVKRSLKTNNANRCRFLYYNEMEEIFVKSPELFETIRIRDKIANLSELSDNETTFNTVADAGEAVSSSPIKILPKPAKITRISVPAEKPEEEPQKSEPHCCTYILKELKKMEEAREASERKRHDEKMAIYKEILHIKKQKLLMLQKLE